MSRFNRSWTIKHVITGRVNDLDPRFDCNYLAVDQGRVIAAVGSCIYAWNIVTADVDFVMRGHNDGVSAIAKQGGKLFSVARDGDVKAWSLSDGKCLHSTTLAQICTPGMVCHMVANGGHLVVSHKAGPSSAHAVYVWSVTEEPFSVTQCVELDTEDACATLLSAGGTVYAGVAARLHAWSAAVPLSATGARS